MRINKAYYVHTTDDPIAAAIQLPALLGAAKDTAAENRGCEARKRCDRAVKRECCCSRIERATKANQEACVGHLSKVHIRLETRGMQALPFHTHWFNAEASW